MHSMIRPLLLVSLLFISSTQTTQANQLSEPDATEAEAADAAGDGEVVETDEVAQPASEPQADEDDEVTSGEAFLLKLKQGGRTMIFLLLCSVVTVACAFERLVMQRRGRIVPSRLAARADRMWSAGELDDLEALTSKSNSTLARMLAAVVRHRRSGVERVSTIAGDIASRDLKRHLQRAYPLAVVATIAPLLGLFGTVIGMIGAFDKIAIMGELANPAAFGGDIGKALITTGAGLAIAITALVLYHWFKSRIGVYSVELEEQVSVLITEWFDPATNPNSKAPTSE